MGSKGRLLITLALAGACAVLAVPGTASAARSGVTIKSARAIERGAGFEGWVFSPKPAQCALDRRVKLFKQRGRKQDPKRDRKVDTAQAEAKGDGRYKWEAHHYRAQPGDYYARVSKTAACQADNSPTVHIPKQVSTTISDVDVNQRRRIAQFIYYAFGGFPSYRMRCKLDHRQYRDCQANSDVLKNLNPGRHVFKVFAIDHKGTRQRTPTKHVFHIKHG